MNQLSCRPGSASIGLIPHLQPQTDPGVMTPCRVENNRAHHRPTTAQQLDKTTRYSIANPCLENLRVLLFSVT
jgi:hypothetical protein